MMKNGTLKNAFFCSIVGFGLVAVKVYFPHGEHSCILDF